MIGNSQIPKQSIPKIPNTLRNMFLRKFKYTNPQKVIIVELLLPVMKRQTIKSIKTNVFRMTDP